MYDLRNASPSLAPAPDAHLAPGVRVRMNALGRERHPRYGVREGVIVGRGSPSSWRIRFDERRAIQAIHQSYLECAPAPARQTVSNNEPRRKRNKMAELAR